MVFTQALATFAYISTLVATLRAGSRLLYIMNHKGCIGQIDGPRILSPMDIILAKKKKRRTKTRTTTATTSAIALADNDDDDEEEEEALKVSPLWETAYAFEAALRCDLDTSSTCTTTANIDVDHVVTTILTKRRKQHVASPYHMSLVSYRTSPPAPAPQKEEEEEQLLLTPAQDDIDDDGDTLNSSCTTTTASDSDSSIAITTNSNTDDDDDIDSDNENESSSSSCLINVKEDENKSDKSILNLLKQQFQSTWKRRNEWTASYGKFDPALHHHHHHDDTTTNTIDSTMEDDFNTAKSIQVKLPIYGNHTRRVAHVTAFAPRVFSDLRHRFGVKEDDFRESMKGPFVSFQSNSKGAARAGGFFFFSRDGAYMIKTVKKAEVQTFLDMLPKYFKYMKRHSRRSLLTRIFGMYEIKIHNAPDQTTDGGTTTSKISKLLHKGSEEDEEDNVLMIMNSVFPAEASQFVSERFDLKGSTVGRECSPEERNSKGSNAILKDLDLAKEVYKDLLLSEEQQQQHQSSSSSASFLSSPSSSVTSSFGFHIGPRSKAALLSQLRQDLRLLVKCNVMDYSLLVGVVDMEQPPNNNGKTRKRFALLPHFDLPFDQKQLISAVSAFFVKKSKHGQSSSSAAATIVGEGVHNTNENEAAVLVESPSSSSSGNKHKIQQQISSSKLLQPLRTISAPTIYLLQNLKSIIEKTLSTVLTVPLPYYGAGICGVDGGKLSVLQGTRHGNRAVYYIGVIDFLQPWTMKKVLEREMKGVLGYDKTAISCVAPKEYAVRFLEFLDAHIS